MIDVFNLQYLPSRRPRGLPVAKCGTTHKPTREAWVDTKGKRCKTKCKFTRNNVCTCETHLNIKYSFSDILDQINQDWNYFSDHSTWEPNTETEQTQEKWSSESVWKVMFSLCMYCDIRKFEKEGSGLEYYSI